MPLEKRPPYLADLVHRDHPLEPFPAEVGQQKGTLTKRQRVAIGRENHPSGGHYCERVHSKVVVTALFGQIRPEVWVSDMLRSQRGHGGLWQVCLAHLLRDAKYAIECGDTAFSAPLRRLLLRAIAIGRRRETLKDATPKQYLHDLDRRLDRIMATVPIGEPGRKLRKRMLANRGHLFVFMTNRDVPYTNNVSERHLRPSVIFRKVTNGFRCEGGAETYAAFRSVVSTAKANRAPVLEIVRFVLSAKRPVEVSRRGRVSNYVNSLVFVQNHCVEVQAAENVQDLRV